MAHRSDPLLCVLHALRLKGFAEAAVLAQMTGLPVADVDGHLAAAGDAGLARRRQGRVTGWSLTPDGRARHAALLEADTNASGARDVLATAYAGFGDLNAGLKQLCTDWQLRTVGGNQVANDHTDAGYDQAVISRLRRFDDEAQATCATVGDALERMARYGPRLRGARLRLEGGDRDGFTRPLAESYHDIWMELHEDLIATLGLVRTGADA